VLLKSWHQAAVARLRRLLVIVYDTSGNAQMYVGVGDARGLYVACNYGENWDLDLIAVGPGGLRGRRRVVEYDDNGNPHEIPVQCLVGFDDGYAIVEFFLAKGGLPLTVEWVSIKGLRSAFIKR
jgi:hypothetical protein